MAGTRKLEIIIAGDAKGATKALEDTDGALSKVGDGIKNLAKVAAVGFAAVAVGAVAFGKSAISAATDLGESLNAVDKIFGANAKTIHDWGKANANAFGLSRAEFNKLATPLGAMLKNAGLPMDKVTGNTIELTKRAADMASVFNVDVSEALEAIQAGLRGESDPLEKFGVGLSAAKVEAEALAMTGKKSAKSLTEQEKALARINLIMKQTASVQGDFAGTSDQLANKTRILKARFTDFRAEIGAKLIPIALTMANVFGDKILPLMGRVSAAISMAVHLIAGGFTTLDRTSDGWHGKMEEIGIVSRRVFDWMRENVPPVLEAMRDAFLKVGDVIMTKVVPAIQAVFRFLMEHKEILVGVAVAIGVGLVAAFLSWAAAAGAAAIATIAAAAPVIAIGVAIAALVAGVIWAYKNWGWFKDAVDTAGDAAQWLWEKVLKPFGEWIANSLVPWIRDDLVPAIVKIGEASQAVAGWFESEGRKIAAPFIEAYDWVDKLIRRIADIPDSLPGWMTFSLSDANKSAPGPKIPMNKGLLEMLGVPGFATGGVMPGPIGKPGLAVLHGGERVIPNGGGGQQTINLQVDRRTIVSWVVDASRDDGGWPITTRSPS